MEKQYTNKQLHISGMNCVNCQNKIERKLKSTVGVIKARVNYNRGIADITYDSVLISQQKIKMIINKMDYKVVENNEKENIVKLICMMAIIICLFFLLEHFGVLNLLVPSQLANSKMGYGMLFVIGLITSVHCIAMCGGINLSQSIPQKKTQPDAQSRFYTFYPTLLYNLGRVVSYTAIGFILGLVGLIIGSGSLNGISTVLQGVLKLIAGVFMVIMGINMLDIFPWMRKFNLRMPESFASIINTQKAKSNRPLIVGLLNGLMPCGPLQSMQLVALVSGNPFAGALSMLLFSLGTVPLMLGLGGVVSLFGQKFTKRVMNIGAVLVVVLGLAMLSQGGSLSGFILPDRLFILTILLGIVGIVASLTFKKTLIKHASIASACIIAICIFLFTGQRDLLRSDDSVNDVQIIDGIQVVTSALDSGSYPDITVQAGIPVKWVINAPQGSINGCNYKILIQDYGIEFTLQEGENILEFTPSQATTVSYSCWMGMIRGNIFVTEEGTAVSFNDTNHNPKVQLHI